MSKRQSQLGRKSKFWQDWKDQISFNFPDRQDELDSICSRQQLFSRPLCIYKHTEATLPVSEATE